MLLETLIEKFDAVAPEAIAQEWDNVGLLVGDRAQDIRRVFIALDADEQAIAEAKAAGAQLLLTHHPMIFSPLKRINTDRFLGARVVELLRSGMSYYAMHTNFDAAQMGVLCAKRMELPIQGEPPLADELTYEGRTYGIGVIGSYGSPIALGALAERVKEQFGLDYVKVFGDTGMKITRMAICPGSGKSTIDDAIEKGAQVLLTGDIDHHSGLDAKSQNLAIIDAGHYGLEHIFIEYMKNYIRENISEVEAVAQKKRMPYQIL
jgi:dinuclear metal center YbgI/SA1388 family protein